MAWRMCVCPCRCAREASIGIYSGPDCRSPFPSRQYRTASSEIRRRRPRISKRKPLASQLENRRRASFLSARAAPALNSLRAPGMPGRLWAAAIRVSCRVRMGVTETTRKRRAKADQPGRAFPTTTDLYPHNGWMFRGEKLDGARQGTVCASRCLMKSWPVQARGGTLATDERPARSAILTAFHILVARFRSAALV